MTQETARDALAALIGHLVWCMSEGYITAEDRAIGGGNWLLEDDATLTDEDCVTKAGLLEMGGELLDALLAAGWRAPGADAHACSNCGATSDICPICGASDAR